MELSNNQEKILMILKMLKEDRIDYLEAIKLLEKDPVEETYSENQSKPLSPYYYSPYHYSQYFSYEVVSSGSPQVEMDLSGMSKTIISEDKGYKSTTSNGFMQDEDVKKNTIDFQITSWDVNNITYSLDGGKTFITKPIMNVFDYKMA